MNQQSKQRPTLAWVYSKPWRLVAFGMGSGLVRPGPGTWGTVWAWLVWLALLQFLPWGLMPVVLIFTFLIGIWACQRSGDDLGVADHGGMVWDEAVAFWMVLWLLPSDTVLMHCLAFGFFRLFDIAKPAPIHYFDRRVAGGFGVMLDDILAAFYCLAALYVVAYFI